MSCKFRFKSACECLDSAGQSDVLPALQTWIPYMSLQLWFPGISSPPWCFAILVQARNSMIFCHWQGSKSRYSGLCAGYLAFNFWLSSQLISQLIRAIGFLWHMSALALEQKTSDQWYWATKHTLTPAVIGASSTWVWTHAATEVSLPWWKCCSWLV